MDGSSTKKVPHTRGSDADLTCCAALVMSDAEPGHTGRTHRWNTGSRWRCLGLAQQASLALVLRP